MLLLPTLCSRRRLLGLPVMMLGKCDGSGSLMEHGAWMLVPGMISGFRRSLLGKRMSLCYVRCSHSSVSLNAQSLPLSLSKIRSGQIIHAGALCFCLVSTPI